jgi:hypothetical protein
MIVRPLELARHDTDGVNVRRENVAAPSRPPAPVPSKSSEAGSGTWLTVKLSKLKPLPAANAMDHGLPAAT